MLAINPTYGEIYRVAGELSARNYRFDEAVALTREAVALDPANTRAYGDLGLHLMRTGDEAEARKALDRAFKDDPYDRVTYNLLAAARHAREVRRRPGRRPHVQVRSGRNRRCCASTPIPLAQEALETLSAKYQFTPKGPILVEMFPKHDDFAVRNLGLPGMIGALGACFGRVVSIDSPHAPRARHVLMAGDALARAGARRHAADVEPARAALADRRASRSTRKGRARPEWGRDMEVPFAHGAGARERR